MHIFYRDNELGSAGSEGLSRMFPHIPAPLFGGKTVVLDTVVEKPRTCVLQVNICMYVYLYVIYIHIYFNPFLVSHNFSAMAAAARDLVTQNFLNLVIHCNTNLDLIIQHNTKLCNLIIQYKNKAL